MDMWRAGAGLLMVVGASLGACTITTKTDTPMDTGDAGDAGPIDGATGDGGACQPLHTDPHWTYEESEMEGPDHWGDLKTKDGATAFPDCNGTTTQQSPIAIPKPVSADCSITPMIVTSKVAPLLGSRTVTRMGCMVSSSR